MRRDAAHARPGQDAGVHEHRHRRRGKNGGLVLIDAAARDSRGAIATADAAPSTAGRVAVVIGNWLEFYDFIVFTFFAVMIGDAFFPGASPITRLLSALATFGAGFLTRPIGAAVIGAYADRVGRRSALTLTLMLMSAGSAIVGLTPPYAQVGIAAPVLLVAARLIQGFSAGGEVGVATTYLLESAPAHKRAAATAWQAHSQQLATMTGSLIGVILATTLSKEALYAWGWRVPFVIGIVIAPVGLYIRRSLPETVVTEAAHRSTAGVLAALVQHHTRTIVLGVLVICGGTVSTYVFSYMTTYAITTLQLSATIGTLLTLTGSVAQIAGFVTGVTIDRFGRKRMLILARLSFVALVYPMWVVMTAPHASAGAILFSNLLLNFVFAIGIGAVYAFLGEVFPASVRSSGLGVVYGLGVLIFGGTTQFVIAWLIDRTGNPIVPAWYQMAATLLAVVGVAGLTRHAEVSDEARTG